jgi:phosphoribosylformylglycinamidine synthase I
MKFGVVVFPGSNCDRDMFDALSVELGQKVQWLWHKDHALDGFTTDDCIVLPGGFSYGDYLRCGAIARFSPMMKSVIEFAQSGGKVFGVCNGFQILCESQLLPGALLRNAHQQFVCRNVHITDQDGAVYQIPVAHGEGRYYADDRTLDRMESNGQILFRYCTESGSIEPSANPNGALRNIAGIRNEAGNVIGMMPHPERACSKALSNTDGRTFFEKWILQAQLIG